MWTFLRPDASKVLEDEKARASLARYFATVENKKKAKFLIAKKIEADFSERDTTQNLWEKHAALVDEFLEVEQKLDSGKEDFLDLPSPEESLLDLKITIAQRILQNCHLCTHRCGVNRLTGNLGYCKCGFTMAVSSIFEHMGEEPELVPSGTIFTMGCTMRCNHCQNYTISQWMETGESYEPAGLAVEVEHLREIGCRNANLVGGEPTPWLLHWLETFKLVNANVPIVWNSNTYYSPETAQLLAGFADVYLLDFKYGPAHCARRISDAPDYWKVCTRNHLEGQKYGELLIRMLILPNHTECCTRPIIGWIVRNLGSKTRVNIMFQYRPEWKANEILELRRRLSDEEMKAAIQLAKTTGLANFIT